jgi:DNA-binding response OmpR family regulator
MENKPTVLVVDDETDIANEIVSILDETKEYNILRAGDGKDAIDKVRSNEVDVVLLDIRMPNMTGIDALKEIKATKNSPEVIMLTALDDSQNAWEASKYGAYDYLTKPFETAPLLMRTKRAAEKSIHSKRFNKNWELLDSLRVMNHNEPARATKIWDRLHEETDRAGLSHSTDLPVEVVQEIFNTTR